MSRSIFAVLAATGLSTIAAWGQQYIINTDAGNGTAGYLDGQGNAAQLNLPGGIFVTGPGAYFVADSGNNRIRQVANGNVTTVAGDGTAAFLGDGASALLAELNNPQALVVDSSNNLYISDTANQVVRKMTVGGKINPYAGNNGYGAGYGCNNCSATAAQLNYPVGLVLDSAGNLYIADSINQAIEKVTTAGNLTTVLGGATGPTALKLSHPVGLAIDSAGNLYIADTGTKTVLKWTPSTNILVSFAGNGTTGFSGDGGLATKAQLADAQGVATDSAGNVYIADTVNNRIRKVATNGIITTIAGTGRQGYTGDGGPATSAQLYSPTGLAVAKNGTIYVADTHNSVIRTLTPTFPTITANGVGNAATFVPPLSPGALATVVGSAFGSATTSPNAPLPAISGGVQVTVNGQAAPLDYVSATQINFQVPWETAVGTATVAVTVNGGSSNTVQVPVVSAGPGLFYNADGSAVVQNYPDYSVNTPSNPIARGGTIIAYLTGSGPVTPAVADGTVTPSTLVQSTSSWSATIGPTNATVSFLGLTPGFVGLVQANIVVPTSLSPGTYPLTVSIGGQASNSATISVK